MTNTYSFVGELLTSKREHRASPTGDVTTVLTTNDYDHVGRLLTVRHRINDQDTVTLLKNEYNEIGQLKTKSVGGDALSSGFHSSTSYAYNERGWTVNTASPYFSYMLKYNDGAVPQYNGNISEQHWGHGATTSSTYSYSYDKLNRLTNGTSTGTAMSEAMSYDDMGNITTLTRDGGTPIAYSYAGNRLTALSGGLSGTYSYDANGNALTDRTGMSLSYNYLNLPDSAWNGTVSVGYLYDALGTKLRKYSNQGGDRDYVGGIEYGSSGIELIHTGEGVAYRNISDNTYTYRYNLTDHLGNIRATLYRNPSTQTVEILQADDYYPFGKQYVVSAGDNMYLYNGKELQGELGGQYDYGARFYDAEIGRWNVVDPLAEQGRRWSPYNYTFNNPIRFIDPDGMWPNDGIKKFFKGFGTTLMDIANGSQLHNQVISSVSTAISTVEHLSKGDYSGAGNQFLESTGAPEVVRTVGKAANGDMEAIGSVAAVVTVGIVTHKAGGKVATAESGVGEASSTGKISQVQRNRMAGNAYRDEVANGLKAEGREVRIEVPKKTPFGSRVIDIEVEYNGKVQGGIETKVGSSRYHPLQRIKDIWLDLNTPGGYPVQEVRKPK